MEVRIDPQEPKCTEPEHDWQSPQEIVGGIKENPGVWVHAAGIIVHEVCLLSDATLFANRSELFATART